MRFLPFTVTCPACGSGDVVYSCTPDCCFNHVCNECLGSFELLTKDLGEKLDPERPGSGKPDPGPREAGERDSCAPTASCARCGGLGLMMIEGGAPASAGLVCCGCHTLLELEFVKD